MAAPNSDLDQRSGQGLTALSFSIAAGSATSTSGVAQGSTTVTGSQAGDIPIAVIAPSLVAPMFVSGFSHTVDAQGAISAVNPVVTAATGTPTPAANVRYYLLVARRGGGN